MYPFHPVADAQHPFVPNEINQRQFSAPYSPPLTQLVFWKVCCDFFFTLFSICHNVKLRYYSNKTYYSLMIKLIILFWLLLSFQQTIFVFEFTSSTSTICNCCQSRIANSAAKCIPMVITTAITITGATTANI